jgi:acylphosphatase
VSEIACKHLWINGRVQGVGFRAGAQHRAQALDLNGWVRNLPDGRVEALVWGDPQNVEQMVAWCRRGPSYAHVTDVQVVEGQPDRAGEGFGVR